MFSITFVLSGVTSNLRGMKSKDSCAHQIALRLRRIEYKSVRLSSHCPGDLSGGRIIAFSLNLKDYGVQFSS